MNIIVGYQIVDDYVVLKIKRRSGEIVECLIDSEDLDSVLSSKYSWSLNWKENIGNYYVSMSSRVEHQDNEGFSTATTFIHRFITNANSNVVVDHKDGNTLDNRKQNLRFATVSENAKNRRGKNKNNKSGYRNVTWDKQSKKWIVQLQIEGKNKRLGRFNDVHEAGEFAEEMRVKYYGKFKGNS